MFFFSVELIILSEKKANEELNLVFLRTFTSNELPCFIFFLATTPYSCTFAHKFIDNADNANSFHKKAAVKDLSKSSSKALSNSGNIMTFKPENSLTWKKNTQKSSSYSGSSKKYGSPAWHKMKENGISCDPPCQNGGTCRPGNLCECTHGYEGFQCELDINECARLRPCDPDFGICKNTPGGYNCQCVPGYKLMYDGKHCIDNERAKQQPHLVFRGRGSKGVVIASRLTNSTNTNLTRYYPRRMKKRSLLSGISGPIRLNTKIIQTKRSQQSLLHGQKDTTLLKKGDLGILKFSRV
ncbi:unnamed protein product [Trichobilharzia regenti]|nr:unnamed protein product [Trichobilharzia regenti]